MANKITSVNTHDSVTDLGAHPYLSTERNIKSGTGIPDKNENGNLLGGLSEVDALKQQTEIQFRRDYTNKAVDQKLQELKEKFDITTNFVKKQVGNKKFPMSDYKIHAKSEKMIQLEQTVRELQREMDSLKKETVQEEVYLNLMAQNAYNLVLKEEGLTSSIPKWGESNLDEKETEFYEMCRRHHWFKEIQYIARKEAESRRLSAAKGLNHEDRERETYSKAAQKQLDNRLERRYENKENKKEERRVAREYHEESRLLRQKRRQQRAIDNGGSPYCEFGDACNVRSCDFLHSPKRDQNKLYSKNQRVNINAGILRKLGETGNFQGKYNSVPKNRPTGQRNQTMCRKSNDDCWYYQQGKCSYLHDSLQGQDQETPLRGIRVLGYKPADSQRNGSGYESDFIEVKSKPKKDFPKRDRYTNQVYVREKREAKQERITLARRGERTSRTPTPSRRYRGPTQREYDSARQRIFAQSNEETKNRRDLSMTPNAMKHRRKRERDLKERIDSDLAKEPDYERATIHSLESTEVDFLNETDWTPEKVEEEFAPEVPQRVETKMTIGPSTSKQEKEKIQIARDETLAKQMQIDDKALERKDPVEYGNQQSRLAAQQGLSYAEYSNRMDAKKIVRLDKASYGKVRKTIQEEKKSE